MSLVDATFAAIPAPLLQDWGISATYIKAGTSQTYSPTTGAVTNTTQSIPVHVLITQIKPEEFDSTYQTTDVKMLLGNSELGNHIPSIRDTIQYAQDGTTVNGRIISVKTYRGDSPVLHVLLVRPQ
jgi:hypothetical protein